MAFQEPCKDEIGNEYQHGSTFYNEENCNRCFCNNGLLGCTRMPCVKPPPEGVCEYNGLRYNAGDSFKDTDGCNTCRCMRTGMVACTYKACARG
ncbi:hypothetical protein DPMN_127351 [Dreissena polymorpha]|uniref:Pacifastin domain-containing protein n=1 Tax=Dreissena polymorpha TaxID=45954 RepID=A0A9D4GYT7_DREPO|nr:hypothetical protein DPMN_127351 [Dreissena polymorpha]